MKVVYFIPTRKDLLIHQFLEATKPRERACVICGNTYIGIRHVCDNEACAWALRARVEAARSLRPLDYVSTARKTFLVEALPPGFEES